MSDFFARLAARTLETLPVVQPLVAPRFAQGQELVSEMQEEWNWGEPPIQNIQPPQPALPQWTEQQQAQEGDLQHIESQRAITPQPSSPNADRPTPVSEQSVSDDSRGNQSDSFLAQPDGPTGRPSPDDSQDRATEESSTPSLQIQETAVPHTQQANEPALPDSLSQTPQSQETPDNIAFDEPNVGQAINAPSNPEQARAFDSSHQPAPQQVPSPNTDPTTPSPGTPGTETESSDTPNADDAPSIHQTRPHESSPSANRPPVSQRQPIQRFVESSEQGDVTSEGYQQGETVESQPRPTSEHEQPSIAQEARQQPSHVSDEQPPEEHQQSESLTQTAESAPPVTPVIPDAPDTHSDENGETYASRFQQQRPAQQSDSGQVSYTNERNADFRQPESHDLEPSTPQPEAGNVELQSQDVGRAAVEDTAQQPTDREVTRQNQDEFPFSPSIPNDSESATSDPVNVVSENLPPTDASNQQAERQPIQQSPIQLDAQAARYDNVASHQPVPHDGESHRAGEVSAQDSGNQPAIQSSIPTDIPIPSQQDVDVQSNQPSIANEEGTENPPNVTSVQSNIVRPDSSATDQPSSTSGLQVTQSHTQRFIPQESEASDSIAENFGLPTREQNAPDAEIINQSQSASHPGIGDTTTQQIIPEDASHTDTEADMGSFSTASLPDAQMPIQRFVEPHASPPGQSVPSSEGSPINQVNSLDTGQTFAEAPHQQVTDAPQRQIQREQASPYGQEQSSLRPGESTQLPQDSSPEVERTPNEPNVATHSANMRREATNRPNRLVFSASEGNSRDIPAQVAEQQTIESTTPTSNTELPPENTPNQEGESTTQSRAISQRDGRPSPMHIDESVEHRRPSSHAPTSVPDSSGEVKQPLTNAQARVNGEAQDIPVVNPHHQPMLRQSEHRVANEQPPSPGTQARQTQGETAPWTDVGQIQQSSRTQDLSLRTRTRHETAPEHGSVENSRPSRPGQYDNADASNVDAVVPNNAQSVSESRQRPVFNRQQHAFVPDNDLQANLNSTSDRSSLTPANATEVPYQNALAQRSQMQKPVAQRVISQNAERMDANNQSRVDSTTSPASLPGVGMDSSASGNAHSEGSRDISQNRQRYASPNTLPSAQDSILQSRPAGSTEATLVNIGQRNLAASIEATSDNDKQVSSANAHPKESERAQNQQVSPTPSRTPKRPQRNDSSTISADESIGRAFGSTNADTLNRPSSRPQRYDGNRVSQDEAIGRAFRRNGAAQPQREQPATQIRIGRIEIRSEAPTSPPAQSSPPPRRKPAISLDDYIKKRSGRA